MESSTSPHLTPLEGTGGKQENNRQLPVNYEAEQALLGAIMTNNKAYERVSDFLAAEQFADETHGRIYEACAKLIERGQLANAITLKNLFDAEESLAVVGGAQYLAQLQSAYVTIINAGDYGRTIHDLYLRRRLIELGEDVVNDAFDHDLEENGQRQIENAEQKLFQLGEHGRIEGGFQPFKTALVQAVEMAEAARKRGGVAGVASGFQELDKLLGGLQNSDLVILAGRPSMGKTALATNIGFNAARAAQATGSENEKGSKGAIVGFFSLEMSAEQLATRMVSEQSGVPSEKIRRGELSAEQFDKIVIASDELSALPFFIDDTPAVSVAQIRTRARRLKRQHGLSLIIVDYLQLMQPPGGSSVDNRVQEVSAMTRGLKAIAKELDLPVIALSQLSRAVEQREDKRPQLADLRESGSIEQDADVVMFVFREQYYLERAEPSQQVDEADDRFDKKHARWRQRCEESYGLAEVIVAKQRHGPIGTRKLVFDGTTTKFGDYVADDHLPEVRG